MQEYPERKAIRIENYDYSTSGTYFITICTQNREKLFWHDGRGELCPPAKLPLSPIGKTLEQAILQLMTHYENVAIDKYCIMPDHVHLILRIESGPDGRIISAPTVSTVIGSMKRWVSKQVGRSVWQKSFYDHIIRNQQDYNAVWEYIENNPLKYAWKESP